MYKSEAVIDNPHARSERGVHQELYAAFTLVTLARRFSNRCDGDFNGGDGESLPAMRSYFRNGLRLVGKEIEALFMKQADAVRQSVARIMTGLSCCLQRERPGPSYPRRSMRPRSKWIRRAAAYYAQPPRNRTPASGSRPKHGGFLIRMPLEGAQARPCQACPRQARPVHGAEGRS